MPEIVVDSLLGINLEEIHGFLLVRLLRLDRDEFLKIGGFSGVPFLYRKAFLDVFFLFLGHVVMSPRKELLQSGPSLLWIASAAELEGILGEELFSAYQSSLLLLTELAEPLLGTFPDLIQSIPPSAPGLLCLDREQDKEGGHEQREQLHCSRMSLPSRIGLLYASR